jgi:SH3-like domain-containing protein
MCDSDVLRKSTIEEYAPDHGLLYIEGRRVRIVRQATRRELVDKDGEIRYLRFAIINRKRDASVEPYLKHQATPIDMERPAPTCRDGMRLP